MGLWWIAKLLYPDHFKEDIRETTRDFYKKFYHVTLADAQIRGCVLCWAGLSASLGRHFVGTTSE